MTLVVDCDSHVMEPADLWLRYLEPRYRDRAIRIETHDGVERLIIGEQVVLQGMLAGLGGAHLDRSKAFMGGLSYADGCEPASYLMAGARRQPMRRRVRRHNPRSPATTSAPAIQFRTD